MVQSQPEKNPKTLPEKQTKIKRTGDMVQMVEHPSNKHEALNSIPNKTKQTNKKSRK
jgi:hypothetical protein